MALRVEPVDSTTLHDPDGPRDRAGSAHPATEPGANQHGANESDGKQDGVEQPSITGAARYLLPSITDLLFILLFVGLCYGVLASRLLDDAGIGWHIRNGQNILATHSIPHVDPFSVTMHGKPWFAWEWLYDAGIAFVYQRLGLNGVVLVSAFVIALTLALVFRIAVARGGSMPATFVLFLLCTVASSIHFLARPHVLGWLITIVWFWILDSATRTGRLRGLLLLPPLMLLWANVHGGFVTGLVLTGIFLAGALLTTMISRVPETRRNAWSEARILAVILAGSALVSFINPYGYHLHQHVYDYLSNRFFMQHIEEFRGPLLTGLPEQFFMILLVITVLGIVAVRGRLRCSEWLLIGFCAFSGLYAARNLPVASMLLVVLIAPLLSRRSAKQAAGKPSRLQAFSQRMTGMESQLRGYLWAVAAVIFTFAVCVHGGDLFGKQLMNAQFRPKRFPVYAVEQMEKRRLSGPIFSLDYWGGYLIYKFYPEVRVIVDDRHDLYGEPYLREYLKIIHVEPGWQAALENQKAALVLMPEKAKLTDALKQSGAWKVIYEDETAVMFGRK